MRFRCYVGIIFLLLVEKSESATQTSCTTYTMKWTWLGHTQTLKTCYPDINEVDDEEFKISGVRDPTTVAFNIRDKKGVKFLPKNLFRTFPDLVAIQVFICSVTSIKENHFKGLTKLKTLNLRYNKIEYVASDAFIDLVSLEYLALDANRIQSLGRNTFSSLKALKKLHLQGNEIQFLPPKIFSSLVNVEYIDLQSNDILSLDENIFESLANLQEINLQYNKLERISKNLFKNNLVLKSITLYGNRIKIIDGSMFDHLSSLNYVDLAGNLCSNKYYKTGSFGAMRDDLKQNCNEVSVQDTLKSLELKCENQKSDLQRQLDSKSREIVAFRQELDAMKQKQELLEKNMEANCEVLSKCVDTDNETDKGVFITFEG